MDEQGFLPMYMGGLGNQLFITAAGFVLSQTHKAPLYITKTQNDFNKHNVLNNDYLKLFQHFGTVLPGVTEDYLPLARAKGYRDHKPRGFDAWEPSSLSPGLILNSYYQFYPALAPFEKQIRQRLLLGLKSYRKSLKTTYDVTNAGFLHIRRGDYLKLPNFHFNQPLEYYLHCANQLNGSKLYILSDDPEWIQSQPAFQQAPFQVVDIPNELEALAFMSLCTAGAVCANSTFSWWGAFLGAYAERAPVFVPERWIGEPIVSLFPPEWAVVSEPMWKPQIIDPDTCFVSLCDAGYFPKAQRTIEELRQKGCWQGDIVLLCVDFEADKSWAEKHKVIIQTTKHISTDRLVETYKKHPLQSMADNRHLGKLYQWDKFQVFSTWFQRWKRVVFLDAGIRTLDTVQPLLDLDWKGKLLAQDDSNPYDNGLRFYKQLDMNANPTVLVDLLKEFGPEILLGRYFLNCMFVFDTALIHQVDDEDLTTAMNRWPICLCNEMGILNLYFTFKLKVWEAFPVNVGSKYLFGWNESNYKEKPTWEAFHFMKYPSTI